jgi:pimeloyl-ACP methyl ester carboxylesterase
MRVVILHGMLGSARNWRTVATALAKTYRVSALDLRNHGESPHTGPFTVGDLSRDVEAWIENNVADGPVAILGHSLGGKTAMKLACRRPDMVRRLIVVDISTEQAPHRWNKIFDAVVSLDLATLKDRKQAEAHLEAHGIDDWAMRKFLTTNLELDKCGGWKWKIGVEALHDSADQIVAPVLEPDEHFDGPVLLLRGGKSEYSPLADIPAMKAHFPALRVETVPDAGHNVHIDAPHAFLDAVRAFLSA